MTSVFSSGKNMLKTLMTVVKYIWIFSAITAGTAIGAIYGWERHGLAGAIALGFVGFVMGALVASSPESLLEFLT